MDMYTKAVHMTGESSNSRFECRNLECCDFDLIFDIVFSVQISGYAGAANIVKVLKSHGVKLQFLIDEGLAVLDGIISGLNGPAAL